MKKYLALAVLGIMLAMIQPSFAQCGCPLTINPCQSACPTCPPRVVYQPVLQPVAPVIQTVAEPVMTYRYRQVATCPNQCNPCQQYGYGTTGAAAPVYVINQKHGFWSDFFGFD